MRLVKIIAKPTPFPDPYYTQKAENPSPSTSLLSAETTMASHLIVKPRRLVALKKKDEKGLLFIILVLGLFLSLVSTQFSIHSQSPVGGVDKESYVVGQLLILISLLVRGSLGLVRGALLVVQRLPALTEDLADLAERDTGVLVTDVLTLLVGEEHVG
jgi:hypothetical protein